WLGDRLPCREHPAARRLESHARPKANAFVTPGPRLSRRNPGSPVSWTVAVLALAVALIALALYYGTLLPGLDFGDTAAFQDAGGALDVTPRQGYPLYFALGNLVVWAVGGEPAYGMNLASAIAAALACGGLTWLATRMTHSTLSGVFTGLLFAGSYTFWSQAVIAEVYALHLLMLTL